MNRLLELRKPIRILYVLAGMNGHSPADYGGIDTLKRIKRRDARVITRSTLLAELDGRQCSEIRVLGPNDCTVSLGGRQDDAVGHRKRVLQA